MRAKVFTIAGQTLADVSLRETGSVEAMFDIAELNGLSVSDELAAGNELYIPVLQKEKKVIEFFKAQSFYPASGYDMATLGGGVQADVVEVIVPKKDEIVVIERQTLADLSIQISGSIDAMFELAALNDLSVSDWLAPGMKLILPGNISENAVNAFYKSNGLYPASGWTVTEQEEAVELSGIDYWIIEENFIVS